MGVDLSRVASKALQAALEDDTPRKKGGSTVKALAAGAALAAAARVAVKQRGLPFVPSLPHMPDMDGLRDMSDRLRDRFAGEPDDFDDVDVEDAPDLEDDEAPQDEAAEDFDE